MGEESINRTYHHFKHAVIFQEVWGILSLKQTLAKRNSFPPGRNHQVGNYHRPEGDTAKNFQNLG